MLKNYLEINERLKCGEVFFMSLDLYSSCFMVECQLCEDKTLCSVSEFLDHIEIWHLDWHDQLDQLEDVDDMEDHEPAVEELNKSTDEAIEPFEKVLIVTETVTELDSAFSESEENCEEVCELNEECEGDEEDEEDESCAAESIRDRLGVSESIAYTVNINDILLMRKSEPSEPPSIESYKDDSNSVNESMMGGRTSSDEADFDDEEQQPDVWVENYIDEMKNCMNDRSEDSGVEKSEVSSISASTPQHSASDDEPHCEILPLTLKEQIRLALNEPPPKPKLTSDHMEKLIEIYESHPRLWQHTHPQFNIPHLSRKSWKELARTWNRACQQNLSLRDLRLRISTLCQRYRKERTRREMFFEFNEPKMGAIVSRFKYFEKLKFLDTHQNVPYEEHSSRLAQEHEKLLEIYKRFPALWASRDRHQKCLELREKAYCDISTALQLIGIHIPPNLVRLRITRLRKRYRLEKMRHLHCKLQGKTFEAGFKQFESMKFLDGYIAPFVCDKCGKIFRKLNDYQMHMNDHECQEKEKSLESDTSEQTSSKSICSEENEFRIDRTEPAVEVKVISDEADQESQQNTINKTLNSTDNSKNTAITFNTSNNIPIEDDSVLEKPETSCINFECAVTETANRLIPTANTFEQTPFILESPGEGTAALQSFFNEDQFFALTTTFDPTVNNLVNPVRMEEFRPNGNTAGTDQTDNASPLNTAFDCNSSSNYITLQVLGNAQEFPIDTTSLIPVELVFDETLKNISIPSMSSNDQNITFVTQYFNPDNFLPMNTIQVTESSEAPRRGGQNQEADAIAQNESTIIVANKNDLSPSDIYFEQSGPVQMNISTMNNHLPDGTHRHNFSVPQTLNSSENHFIDQLFPDNCIPDIMGQTSNLNLQTNSNDSDVMNAAIKSIQSEMEADADRLNSPEYPMKGKTTSDLLTNDTEELPKTAEDPQTQNGGKLTAKIECGSFQMELHLDANQQYSALQETTLMGRLTREQALELIAHYRDYPELWHPEHPNYNARHLRNTSWRALTKELNKILSTDFSWVTVQRKILDYVKYYKQERRRVQKKGGCTTWMFYDNFSFLDEVLSPPTNLEKRIQQKTEALKLIEVYEEFPQLWNTRHPQFTKRHLRRRVISEMCSHLQTIYSFKIDEAKLKTRLLELRKEYRSTKIARVAAERREEPFDPSSHFEFYENLKFLENHVPPFNCLDCKMEFKCFTDYNGHMKKEHKGYKRSLAPLMSTEKDSNDNVCHICGIKFTLRHNLLQHLTRHYVGRTLPCKVCGKKFFTKTTLVDHERTHTKEPGVICDDCGHTFVNMSKLNQHKKRHRNQRDHKCEVCEKCFYSAFDRDRHMRRHYQIRDKICHVCGKAFAMGSAYYAHMKLHSDKKEYICGTCGKDFAQYAGLYKHRKRYHPDTSRK